MSPQLHSLVWGEVGMGKRSVTLGCMTGELKVTLTGFGCVCDLGMYDG